MMSWSRKMGFYDYINTKLGLHPSRIASGKVEFLGKEIAVGDLKQAIAEAPVSAADTDGGDDADDGGGGGDRDGGGGSDHDDDRDDDDDD